MGDSGEGLVDAESRIQERLDEIARERDEKRATSPKDPEAAREYESLRMARAEFERQLQTPAYERRWPAIRQGIDELDRRMAALKERLG
jgi:hypothetical protein